MTQKQQEAATFVAQQAMRHYDELTAHEKVLLLDGLSLFLPPGESEAASQTAWMVSKCEEQQLKFRALLKEAQPKHLPGHGHGDGQGDGKKGKQG